VDLKTFQGGRAQRKAAWKIGMLVPFDGVDTDLLGKAKVSSRDGTFKVQKK